MEGMGNPDEGADVALIAEQMAKIEPILDFFMQAIQALGERVDALEELVVEKLIGGLAGIAEERDRSTLGESLRKDHPEFGKFSDFWKSAWGRDVYDDVTEKAFEAKKSGGDVDALIKAMLDDYEGRLGKFLTPAEAKAEEPPKESGVEIEIKKEPAGDGVSPSVAAILSRVKATRK